MNAIRVLIIGILLYVPSLHSMGPIRQIAVKSSPYQLLRVHPIQHRSPQLFTGVELITDHPLLLTGTAGLLGAEYMLWRRGIQGPLRYIGRYINKYRPISRKDFEQDLSRLTKQFEERYAEHNGLVKKHEQWVGTELNRITNDIQSVNNSVVSMEKSVTDTIAQSERVLKDDIDARVQELMMRIQALPTSVRNHIIELLNSPEVIQKLKKVVEEQQKPLVQEIAEFQKIVIELLSIKNH